MPFLLLALFLSGISRPDVSGAVAPIALTGLRGDRLRREHGARQLHGGPGARQLPGRPRRAAGPASAPVVRMRGAADRPVRARHAHRAPGDRPGLRRGRRFGRRRAGADDGAALRVRAGRADRPHHADGRHASARGRLSARPPRRHRLARRRPLRHQHRRRHLRRHPDRILLDWRHRHPRDVHVGRGAERDRRHRGDPAVAQV